MATGRVPTTANSPLTAKGDLFTYSTAPARLAVGTNGDSLVADSAAATGLRYSATPSASNPVLNSAMQVWQRATTFTVSGFTYVADRWQAYRGVAGYTVSRQTTSDTTNLPNIQYALRGQRDSGNTSTSDIYLAQSFESVNSIPFAGKTVTLSFYARAGANWSPTSGNLRVRLFTGTGTDQNVLSSGYTGSATPIDNNVPLTTTWQRFTYSGTVATSTTEIGIYANAIPVGTAGAADYFEITGVQLDIGSVALPFRTYAATIQGELAACQRYYWRTGTVTTGDQLGGSWGYGCTGSYARFLIKPPVTMRVPPTSTDYSAVDLTDPPVGTLTGTTITSQTYTADAIQFVLSSSGTVNARYMYYTTARSSASYLGFSAEL